MRYTESMRYTLIILAVSFAACKARDQSSGGLLSAAPKAATEQFTVACVPDETAMFSYQLDVTQAIARENAPLKVRVAKLSPGQSLLITEDDGATGAISLAGSVDVAFTAGSLNAEAAAAAGEHLGILTVFGDPDADGLVVQCKVTLKDFQG